jgi:hypothetical protein
VNQKPEGEPKLPLVPVVESELPREKVKEKDQHEGKVALTTISSVNVESESELSREVELISVPPVEV